MAGKNLKLFFGLLVFFSLAGMSLSLTEITVVEGDLIKLNTTAVDPNEDKVFYYYSPPFNESGEWQTTYEDAGVYHTKITASDGKVQTEEEVIVTVKNKNRAPKIEKRNITLDEGDLIDLKQLISDPDEDLLKMIFEKPFDEKGVWQTGYSDLGIYNVLVVVSDLEFKAEEVINIEIKDKNRAPVVNSSFSEDKTIELKENSTAHFSVLADDSDGDILTYIWLLDNKKISGEASFERSFDFESAGTHELMVIISDQRSETKKTWNLEVGNINRAPLIDQPDIIVNEGEKIIFQLPKTDLDGETVEYTFTQPFQMDGTWQTNYDDAGAYDITITASDGDLATKKEVKITIKDVDRAPVINIPKEITLKEMEELNLDVKELVEDPDGDDLVVTVENLPQGATFEQEGLYWKPDYDFVKRKVGFLTNLLSKWRLERYVFLQQKEADLTIKACGKDSCTNQILSLIVENVNRKPVLGEIPDIEIMETEKGVFKPQASDPDGDFIKYYFEKPFNSKGEWQTKHGDGGEFFTTVTASDGSLTDSKTIQIKVTKKNRMPTLKIEKDYFKINENETVSFSVGALDLDGDNLTVYAEDLPEGASFNEGVFSWKPTFEMVKERLPNFWNNLWAKSTSFNRRFNKEYKQFIVNFTASDGEFKVVHPVLITVKNVNRAPSVTNYSPVKKLTVKVGSSVVFYVKASDPDMENLTYTWDFGLWDKKIIGPETIKRTFKTPGTKTIKVLVSDGTLSVEKEWQVVVKALAAKKTAAKPAATTPK